MNTLPFADRLRQIAKLIGDENPQSEILAAGWRLKRELSDHITQAWVSMNTLDQMISGFTRDPDWVWGHVAAEQKAATPGKSFRAPKYDRRRKTLEIVSVLATAGETVHIADIIEALRQEGEDLPDKSLATAVGNVLTRSGNWHRVGPGEYAPISVNGAN